MAYTAQKVAKGSEHAQILRPGELSTIRHTYHLNYSGSGGTAIADALAASGLPLPKVSRLGNVLGRDFICMAVEDVALVDNHQSKYICQVLFGARTMPDVPYVKVTRVDGVRLVDRWRTGSGFPTDGTAAFPPTAAESVGGTALDIAGTPVVRYRVPTQRITVEVMHDATRLKHDTGTGFHDYNAELSTYAYKRNTNPLLGWPKGKLIYEGGTESPVDDIWRVRSYNFLADDWYHLEQRPDMAPDGSPRLGASATWDSTTVYQSAKAWWYQPFPSFAALEALLPTGVLSEYDNPGPGY